MPVTPPKSCTWLAVALDGCQAAAVIAENGSVMLRQPVKSTVKRDSHRSWPAS